MSWRMSSSRVQVSFTGRPGIATAACAASTTKSISARRPKPPPISVVRISTCAGGNPAAFAASSRAMLAAWVGAQTVRRGIAPGSKWAVQFMGSRQAWARNGSS